ncbi:MAG: CCA tRNA nucleotidyltransferase [Phycisphaerales bacterium]
MSSKATPEHARAAAVAIVRTLRDAGHIAYLAGGCVRDELLGLAPADFDVATDATPARLRVIFPRTAEVGEAFGVVLVTVGKSEGLAAAATVEVATFRADGPYSDRRRPDVVTFSDALADARRRDFTINALFLDPLADEPRRIIDHVGGRDDLSRRLIRAVGDPEQRLAEDHLRALRAVRLAARLSFTIDAATADAIRRHAADLKGVSRERIGDELRRMLASPTRAAAARLLQSLTLDGPVLGESAADTPIRVLAGLPADADYPTSLAAWAIDRGIDRLGLTQTVQRWRRALCLSNEERTALRAALAAHNLLKSGAWTTLPMAGQKRAAVAEGFASGLVLLAADEPAVASGVRARLAHLEASIAGLAPAPLLVGDDLIAAGFKPGPAFKTILDRIYDAQLEGQLDSKIAALELARRLGV